MKKRSMEFLIFLAVSLALYGCGTNNIEYEYWERESGNPGNLTTDKELERKERTEGRFFGSALQDLFDGVGGDNKKRRQTGPSIEVSALLWRASLDTISFMPLKSADPFGGVIITDWYTPPETPKERLKLTVYILTRQLRSDGIRVSVFRETLNQGVWRTATVAKETAIKLENKILYRARELRIASKRDY